MLSTPPLAFLIFTLNSSTLLCHHISCLITHTDTGCVLIFSTPSYLLYKVLIHITNNTVEFKYNTIFKITSQKKSTGFLYLLKKNKTVTLNMCESILLCNLQSCYDFIRIESQVKKIIRSSFNIFNE